MECCDACKINTKYAEVGRELEFRVELNELPEQARNAKLQIQATIFKNGASRIRVRNEEDYYTCTIKNDTLAQEAEVEISEEIFNDFMETVPESEWKIKNRYELPDGWIVDEYLNLDGTIDQYLAELEAEELKIPDWIKKYMKSDIHRSDGDEVVLAFFHKKLTQ